MAPKFRMKPAKAAKASRPSKPAAMKVAPKPVITNGSKAGPSASAMQHANANASFKRAPGLPKIQPKPSVMAPARSPKPPSFGAPGGGAGNFSGPKRMPKV